MALIEQLDKDIVTAMKARDTKLTTTLRGLKSDVKNLLISQKRHGETPTDTDVTDALTSAAKRRKDSIDQYDNAGRKDLADIERYELEVIQRYLPEQMSEDKVREIISAEIKSLGLNSPAQIGQLMKEIMPKLKGKADGKLINTVARELLS